MSGRTTSADPAVEILDGGVVLGGRPVVQAVDLRIEAGEFVALMGANGSGKSTLVRAVTGLRPLTSGELRLFGTDQRRFRDWRRVGYVPQRAGAGSGVPASVWEVVAAGRLVHRRLLRPLGRTDRAAIADALELVGLAERASDPVTTLSGGQQQRVLIARALVAAPDLYVLDEPTAGVDAANQQALADALGALSAQGATVLLVAHELGPLAPLVDRVVTVREGRVLSDGPPAGPVPGGHGGHGADHDHGGSHCEPPQRHDHAPHLGSPVDDLDGTVHR